MAPQTGQHVALLLRFDALGYHPQVQAMGQGDDGAGDAGIVGIVGIGEQVAHKALVDLELVQGQAFQVRQR